MNSTFHVQVKHQGPVTALPQQTSSRRRSMTAFTLTQTRMKKAQLVINQKAKKKYFFEYCTSRVTAGDMVKF